MFLQAAAKSEGSCKKHFSLRTVYITDYIPEFFLIMKDDLTSNVVVEMHTGFHGVANPGL